MLEADDTFVFGRGHQQRRSHVLLERRMPPPSVRTITHAESTHNKQSTECDFPPLSYQSRTSKTREVISMMFHPELDILIAIWSDGVLRSWNSEKGTISSQMSPHSVQDHSFLNLVFTQSGTRLITTDHVCAAAPLSPPMSWE